jgi:hypothetical protein
MVSIRTACHLRFEDDDVEGRVTVQCSDSEDEAISARVSLLGSISWNVLKLQLADELKNKLGVKYRSLIMPDGSKASNHHSNMLLTEFLRSAVLVHAAFDQGDATTLSGSNIAGEVLWHLPVPAESVLADWLVRVSEASNYDPNGMELILTDGRVLKTHEYTIKTSDIFQESEFITISGSRKSSPLHTANEASREFAELERAMQLSLTCTPDMRCENIYASEEDELANAIAASSELARASTSEEDELANAIAASSELARASTSEEDELARAIAASLAITSEIRYENIYASEEDELANAIAASSELARASTSEEDKLARAIAASLAIMPTGLEEEVQDPERGSAIAASLTVTSWRDLRV